MNNPENGYNEEYYEIRHNSFLKKNLDKIPAFKVLKELVAPVSKECILEAGCGIGYVLNHVCHDSKAEGFGIDFSSHAVSRAQSIFPSFKFYCQDATNTNFPDNHFDKVFCFHVIEHVEDYKKLLEEFNRILKPGGVIIIGTEMLEALNTKIFNLLIGDPTHVKEFYKQELLNEIGKTFDILEYKTASCVGRFPHIINLFFHMFLKGEIIVKAKKRLG